MNTVLAIIADGGRAIIEIIREVGNSIGTDDDDDDDDDDGRRRQHTLNLYYYKNRPLFRGRSVQLEFFVPAKSKSVRFRFISLK